MEQELAGVTSDMAPQGTADNQGQAGETPVNVASSVSTTEPLVDGGQPNDSDVQATEQPATSTDSVETLTPEAIQQLQKDYKALQTEFGTRNEADKAFKAKFDGFGGADTLLETANALQNNPAFAEWAAVQQKAQLMNGVNVTDMDDDQKQALGLVEQIANNIVEKRLAEITNTQIKPLMDNAKEQNISSLMSKMDTDNTLPPNWREYQDTMQKLSGDLPQGVQDNPSYDNMVDLLWSSVRANGDMNKIGAELYKKGLENKQAQSTEKPATNTMAKQIKNAKTVKEAWQQGVDAGQI